MDHIETKILNSYTIQEAAQNMVFAARLPQMLAISLIQSICKTLFFISCQLTIISLY